MHLMTFLQLKQPGPVFRATVIVAQWIFTLMFSTMYLVNPHYCHRQDIFLNTHFLV
jgi:threonyl-tRNA synthetase